MKKKPEPRKDRAKNGPERDSRGLFVVGNSGRPKGRPDRRTAPFREKIDKALPDILDTVIQEARNGDMAAARILIDKSLPSVKPVETARPLPIGGSTLTDRAASVVDAVSTGSISVDEAARLIQALGSMARILEADQLEARISKLEAQYGSKN
jgi:hypothetical protein